MILLLLRSVCGTPLCIYSSYVCMSEVSDFDVEILRSSKCIAESYLLGTVITFRSHYKFKIFVFSEFLLSASVIKIPENPVRLQVIFPKQHIFLTTETSSNDSPAPGCPSILTHCSMGLSPPQEDISEAAGLPRGSHPPCAFQSQYSRDSPWSSLLLRSTQFTPHH